MCVCVGGKIFFIFLVGVVVFLVEGSTMRLCRPTSLTGQGATGGR